MFTGNETFGDLLTKFSDNSFLVVALLIYLVVVSITDYKKLIISNKATGSFFLVSVVLFVLFDRENVFYHVIGGVVGFLLLFIPAMIKDTPMGGDIKMMAVLGWVVGLYGVLVIVGISCVLGVLYLIYSYQVKKVKWIAFAPVFSVATLCLTGYGLFG